MFALLFGGIWAFVGWTVALTFGLIGGAPWDDWILDRRGVTAQGRPFEVAETGVSINRRRVYRIRFRFLDQSGASVRAAARSADRQLVEKARLGEPMLVQYDPSSPERVRFEGQHRSLFGAGGLVPFVFALIGTTILAAGIRGSLRRRRLLKYGELSRGRVTAVTNTSTAINRRPVMEVTYEFWSSAGQIRATERHLSPPDVGTEVAVLYDASGPGRSLLAEPGAFR